MRCHIWRQDTAYEWNAYRPFCSERWLLLDLDNWLSERYRVSWRVETLEKTRETDMTEQAAKGKRE